MSQPGSIGNIVPRNEDWIAREIADLKRQIQELRGARPMDAATIGSGGIEIVDGGSLTMKAASGSKVLYEGIALIPDGSGRTQQVFEAYRDDDGTVAFSLGDYGAVPGHLHQQAVQWRDRSGHIVFAEDATGDGIARPYVPLGSWQSNSAPTDVTTSGSFVTAQAVSAYRQHPQITGDVLVYSDTAGTTGEWRIIDQAANVVVGPIAITSLRFSWVNYGPLPLPGGHMTGLVLSLQVRRTAGTGSVGVRGGALIGVQA